MRQTSSLSNCRGIHHPTSSSLATSSPREVGSSNGPTRPHPTRPTGPDRRSNGGSEIRRGPPFGPMSLETRRASISYKDTRAWKNTHTKRCPCQIKRIKWKRFFQEITQPHEEDSHERCPSVTALPGAERTMFSTPPTVHHLRDVADGCEVPFNH